MILKVYLIKLPILVDCMNSVELAPVASAFKIDLPTLHPSCRSLNSSRFHLISYYWKTSAILVKEMPLFPPKKSPRLKSSKGNVILNGNEVSPAVSRPRGGLTHPSQLHRLFSYPASPQSDSPPIRQRSSPSDKECHCMLMIYSMSRCPPSYSFQTFRLCACRVSDLRLPTFERPDEHPNRRTTLHSIKP